MKRNICLVSSTNNAKFKNFDNIIYTNIDNIVNNSVDILYCGILNEITPEEYNGLLPRIFNKIRLGGQLIFAIEDVKSLASMYANNIIDDTELLLKIKNLKNIISLHKIEKLIEENKEFVVLNLEEKDNQYVVLLQREGL